MKIVDKKDGEWFISRALYPYAHGTREGVRFEPQVPTKIKSDAWIESQPLIVACPDPTSGEEMPGPIQTESVLRDPDTKEVVQGDPAARAATEANAKLNGKTK